MGVRLVVAVALVLAGGGVQAHGGGLDERGCHHASDSDRYHCHRGSLDGRSFDSEAEARRSQEEAESRGTGDVSGSSSYDRDAYGDWRDKDGDCQDTRDEVVIERSRSYELDEAGCEVVAGVWRDPFTGKRLTDPSGIHIDHVLSHLCNMV